MKTYFFLSLKIFKKSFSFYFDHLIFFTKLATGLCLPWSVIFVLLFFSGLKEEPLLVVLRIFTWVALILIFVLYIAVVKSIERLEQGEKKSVLSCYREAIKLLPAFLKVLGWLVLKIFLWVLLLLVPGFIFGCFYSFSLLAFLIHQKKGKEALIHSQSLIKPNLGRFIVACSVISIVMQIVWLLIIFWADRAYGIPLFSKNLLKLIVNISLINLFTVIINILPVVFSVFLYRAFCQEKESINPNLT